MGRTVFIALFAVLAICFLGSCKQEPADRMTASFRSGRQKFHEATNIWLPELENVEITNSDITETGHKPLVNISFPGDETLFSQLVSFFNEKAGKNPDQDFEDLKWWEMQYTDSGQVYVGNISINLYNSTITIAGHFFRGFTVQLTANPSTGGTVTLKQAGNTIEGAVITTAENSNLDFIATPASGYQFDGWYDGNTKIKETSTYYDYQVPDRNIVIEARFSLTT